MQTAEAQIWDRARQIEQSRVEAQHVKMRESGKTSKINYNPEKVSKPWTWGNSAKHSLHNIDAGLVFSVSSFNFDLNDESFVDFLNRNFHLHMCRTRGSTYWNALNDHSFTKSDFLENKDFQFAQEYEGKRYKYGEGELLSLWKIFHFSKVFLQGAFDRFNDRNDEI